MTRCVLSVATCSVHLVVQAGGAMVNMRQTGVCLLAAAPKPCVHVR